MAQEQFLGWKTDEGIHLAFFRAQSGSIVHYKEETVRKALGKEDTLRVSQDLLKEALEHPGLFYSG